MPRYLGRGMMSFFLFLLGALFFTLLGGTAPFHINLLEIVRRGAFQGGRFKSSIGTASGALILCLAGIEILPVSDSQSLDYHRCPEHDEKQRPDIIPDITAQYFHV